MTNSTTDVAIIIGSDSDLPIVEASFAILDSFGVNYTKNVMSAHRTPHEVMELIKTSEKNGCKVFIAAAGMAAHLAGAVAAHSSSPVLGVPTAHSLNGLDAILSTLQMPAGVPVATFAAGTAGATNAGIFAAQMLGVSDASMAEKMVEFKKELREKTIQKDKNLDRD